MKRTFDKLQKYAALQVEDRNNDVIMSKDTLSCYYNFNGNTLRISDHLPVGESTVTMSIITTSDPNLYVMNQHKTGRLTILKYSQAKEVVRTFKHMADIFRKPTVPFSMEQDVIKAFTDKGDLSDDRILGLPVSSFTPKQLAQIRSYTKQALANRENVKKTAAHAQEVEEKLR